MIFNAESCCWNGSHYFRLIYKYKELKHNSETSATDPSPRFLHADQNSEENPDIKVSVKADRNIIILPKRFTAKVCMLHVKYYNFDGDPIVLI